MFDAFEGAAVGSYAASGALDEQAVSAGREFEPWEVCPDSAWCGEINDRMSASMINKRIVDAEGGSNSVLFTAGAGMVLHPDHTKLWCAFNGDGGTMPVHANHGCSEREYCNPNHTSCCWPEICCWPSMCPWHPRDLEYMLRVHEKAPWGYNELLVNTYHWPLPDLIEAFFWVGSGREAAHAVHRAFLNRFPHVGPRLFHLDLSRSGTASGVFLPEATVLSA